MMISKNPPTKRHRSETQSDELFGSFLSKDDIRSFAQLDFPEGTRVAVVSPSKIKGVRSHKLKRVRLSSGATAAMLDGDVAPVVLGETAAPSAKAFEPGPRARALLRGIEIAESDLAESGGAFDFPQVQRLLRGVSRQRIDQRVQDGSLLAVPGPSNKRRFPALQFDPYGNVIGGLDRVQANLGFTSPWAVLNFLASPLDDLKGQKPIDLLRKGKIEPVLEVARRQGIQGA
jgi:hypothetical protein